MDSYGINHAAGEWLSCEGVVRNPEKALGEIACAFLSGRHIGDSRNAFARTRAFVVAKEKRAIAFEWPTDRAAKLLAAVLRFRSPAGRSSAASKDALGKLKTEPEVVASGFRRHYAFARLRRSGVIVLRDIFKLANGVHRGRTPKVFSFGIHVVNPVEEEVVPVFARALT